MTRRLVVATRNRGKLVEFGRLLGSGDWELLSLDDAGVDGDIEETADSYAGNALLKAEGAMAATGLPAVADDSGIEALALGAWPGVRSARWLDGDDRDRLEGLRRELAARSPHDPRVRYVCVVALARPDGPPVTAMGECAGVLVEPRGAGGFGYDPAFLSTDLGVTFGEASDAEKDRVSHRARALRRLIAEHLAPPAAAP